MEIDLFLKSDQRRLTWETGLTGLLFAVATFFCSLYHEPWLDEVQSWILAQSASSTYIIFEHPHWGAHPTLWDLVLKVI